MTPMTAACMRMYVVNWPTRGAGSTEQAELAQAFDDGHRERVEDQEGAGEQGDRGDERRRRREVAGRRLHRRRDVARRGDDVRLAEQSRLERVDDRDGIGAGCQVEVDAA